MGRHRKNRPKKGRTCRGGAIFLQQVLVQMTALVIADYVRDLIEVLSAL